MLMTNVSMDITNYKYKYGRGYKLPENSLTNRFHSNTLINNIATYLVSKFPRHWKVNNPECYSSSMLQLSIININFWEKVVYIEKKNSSINFYLYSFFLKSPANKTFASTQPCTPEALLRDLLILDENLLLSEIEYPNEIK